MSGSGSETPDQAATRRRWVTLAEVVAVAGVVIAALTLWTSWSDRRADRADKIAEERKATQEKGRFDLKAQAARDGGSIVLSAEGERELRDVTIRFPAALSIPVQEPADFTLSTDAFGKALLKATDGGADDQTGRLPVLVTVQYWNGDAVRSASGIYDVIWRTHGRHFLGRALTLEGLRLRQRGGSPAALDAAWKREVPAR